MSKVTKAAPINVAEMLAAVQQVHTAQDAKDVFAKVKAANAALGQFKQMEWAIAETRFAQVLLLWRVANVLADPGQGWHWTVRESIDQLKGVDVEHVHAAGEQVRKWPDLYKDVPSISVIVAMARAMAGDEGAASEVRWSEDRHKLKVVDGIRKRDEWGSYHFPTYPTPEQFDEKYGDGEYQRVREKLHDRDKAVDATWRNRPEYVTYSWMLAALFEEVRAYDGLSLADAIAKVESDRHVWMHDHEGMGEALVRQRFSQERWKDMTPFDVADLAYLDGNVVHAVRTVADLKLIAARQEQQIAAVARRLDLIKAAIQLAEAAQCADVADLRPLKGSMLERGAA